MAEEEANENEEAAAGGEDADGEEGEQKKGKNKLLLIGVPLIVLLLVGGAVMFMGGGDDKPEGEVTEEVAKEDAKPKPQVADLVFYDLPEILVNLSADGRRKTFLKISISLEVEDQGQADQLKKLEPRIVDKFQVYLRGLTVEDLQGTQGVYRLREELLNRVNTTAEPIKVTQVLFKEILVQ